jgi:hypothetical protein
VPLRLHLLLLRNVFGVSPRSHPPRLDSATHGLPDYFDLSLVDARELVEIAQPYNSKYAAEADWHQEVLQRLKPALDALRELGR